MPLQTGDIITEDTVFVEADFPMTVVYLSGSGSRWIVKRLMTRSRTYDGFFGHVTWRMTDRILQFRTIPDGRSLRMRIGVSLPPASRSNH